MTAKLRGEFLDAHLIQVITKYSTLKSTKKYKTVLPQKYHLIPAVSRPHLPGRNPAGFDLGLVLTWYGLEMSRYYL